MKSFSSAILVKRTDETVMVGLKNAVWINALRWNAGRSLFWQSLGVLGAWIYVVILHWNNDGLWYVGDAARHAANGLFWWDFLSSLPVNPFDYALSYFARYPVINPTMYPPAFYLLEGAAYRLFGVSPYIAKGLVLGFVLAGTFYLVAWLRRWVDKTAGWAGILFALQPAIIAWGHAIMLNIPTTVLGVATFYHWRRWLETQPSRPSRHLYLASIFALLAVLTYTPSIVVVVVMVAWILLQGKTKLLLQKPLWGIVGLSLTILVPWAVVQWTWDPAHRAVGLYLGDHPFWKLDAWTFYLKLIPEIVTIPLFVAALAAVALGLWGKRWKSEVSLLGVWFAVCYIWFSIFSVKEERLILLLIPPIVCLGAVGIVGGLQWLSETVTPSISRLILPALLCMVVFHLWAAQSVHVPVVRGFQDIVAYLRVTAPDERVFYEGGHNGVFSFYLRADDQQFRGGVTLGSKLLYALRITPGWGTIELATSPADVVDRFRTKCGCKWVLVERQIGPPELKSQKYLHEALNGSNFRYVRSFHVEAPNITRVDLYEYLGTILTPSQVELPFPILGEKIPFKGAPIQR